MVDVYMIETGVLPGTSLVTDITNPISKKWLNMQANGRTCQMRFSPAGSPSLTASSEKIVTQIEEMNHISSPSPMRNNPFSALEELKD
jgi:hypothetical protein